MQSCSCYPPLNHLNEGQVLLFCKIRYQSHFLSIHSPAYKTQSCMIYSNRLVTFHLKMATRLVFVGRRTEKRHHSTFLCLSIIKQFNAITFLKAVLCGYTGKSIFNGFIPTIQFIEKQHILTLKALILYSNLFCFLQISIICSHFQYLTMFHTLSIILQTILLLKSTVYNCHR